MSNGQSSIPEAVNAEVENRTADIAANAAAQVDQANKDAEAIARAAAATNLGERINSVEGNIAQWKSDQQTAMANLKAEQAEFLASIRATLAPPALPNSEASPTIVVNPEKAAASEQSELGKPGEQTETRPLPKPTSAPESPPARKRVLL